MCKCYVYDYCYYCHHYVCLYCYHHYYLAEAERYLPTLVERLEVVTERCGIKDAAGLCYSIVRYTVLVTRVLYCIIVL